jgi:hypothetical protein
VPEALNDYLSLYEPLEARVFVSQIENGLPRHMDTLEIPERIGNASAGLIIADINFDGIDDVVVLHGGFGNRGIAEYSGFVYQGEKFIETNLNAIPLTAIDTERGRIIGYWHGGGILAG